LVILFINSNAFAAFFSGLATKIKTKSEEIKQDLKKLGEELTKNNDGPIVEKGN
jgi:heme oxygenase